ncbi:MAG: hypothetical protein P8Y07_11685 [Gemmatimonadales bacterium]
MLRVVLAMVLAIQLAACGREGGSAAGLEAAVHRSISLMNEADWEAAYREVLTNAQRSACSLEEYAASEGAGLEALRETVGAGELNVIELNTEVVGSVGLVEGTIIYTSKLSDQVHTEGPVSGAGLVARRNLGTATAENPDYWIFEDGAWRWVQRRPDSPCFNEADLRSIEPVQKRLGADGQD